MIDSSSYPPIPTDAQVFSQKARRKACGCGEQKTPQFYFNEIIRRLWFGWLLILFDCAGPESQDVIPPALGTAFLSPRGTRARAVWTGFPWTLSGRLCLGPYLLFSSLLTSIFLPNKSADPGHTRPSVGLGDLMAATLKARTWEIHRPQMLPVLLLIWKIGERICLTLYGCGYE